MTKFINIKRIIAEFDNRDGVPTMLVITPRDPSDVNAEMVTWNEHEGVQVTIIADLGNNSDEYKFVSGEDWEFMRFDEAHKRATSKPEPKPLGKVGQAITAVVCLAILTPLIGILWAWGAEVMRSFG